MNDLISRKRVLKAIEKLHVYGFATLDEDKLIETINKLPSVTLEEKTGHWMKVTNGRGGHECDLCHEYALSYRNGDEYLTKYCPNCGARMETSE